MYFVNDHFLVFVTNYAYMYVYNNHRFQCLAQTETHDGVESWQHGLERFQTEIPEEREFFSGAGHVLSLSSDKRLKMPRTDRIA